MENQSLVADLLEFVTQKPRTYDEVMSVWRTSCPRLTIWEDALDNHLVEFRGRIVSATEEGKAFVQAVRRQRDATISTSK